MPWPLYLALKQLFPTGKRFGSFFFLMSVLGVALGVMVLVIVQSVMGGFGAVHRERMVETTGHIDLTGNGRAVVITPETWERLEATPEVVHLGPYARGIVLAQRVGGNVPLAPTVFGIDPIVPAAYGLDGMITQGSVEDLSGDTVIVSRQFAFSAGVRVGDSIEVYTPTMIEALQADEVILPRELEVVGVYNLEWNPDYAPGLIVTLRAMQDMYGLGPRIHGVTVRLTPEADEFAVAEQWNSWLPMVLYAQTWKERWASFLWVLDLEKTMLLFINLVIVAVAVFAISIAQLLNVLRKTREIGVLGAFGGRPREFWGLYCWQGLLIGVLGTALGIVLAVGLLAVRDPIIGVLSSLTGTKQTLIDFYYFAHLPVKYSGRDFVVITIAALFLSTLASFIPAWRASRLKPAEAIRIEM
jgi:lipoprotein-releasing system permease protein